MVLESKARKDALLQPDTMAFSEMVVPTTKWWKAGQNADASKADVLLERRKHGTKKPSRQQGKTCTRLKRMRCWD
jgi:hypothetical protein